MTRIYFVFLKKHPRPNLTGFRYQTRDQRRQILELFCKLVPLTLGKYSVNWLRVTKLSNKSRGLWQVRSKKLFPDTITLKIFASLVFMWNRALWKQFNFYFQRDVYSYWQNFHFCEKGWALDYNSLRFWYFFDFF